jgi:DNA-binding CsgD family transcriptional regulator
VRSHIRNVYRKLEVHSAAAAVSRLLGRKNDPPSSSMA